MNCCDDNIESQMYLQTTPPLMFCQCLDKTWKCQLPLPLPWLQCTVYCLLPTGQNFLFFLQESTTTLFMWLLCRVVVLLCCSCLLCNLQSKTGSLLYNCRNSCERWRRLGRAAWEKRIVEGWRKLMGKSRDLKPHSNKHVTLIRVSWHRLQWPFMKRLSN